MGIGSDFSCKSLYQGFKQKMHNISHFAEIDKAKPDQVVVGKQVNKQTGEIEDVTISRDLYNKIHHTIGPKVAGAFLIMTLLGVPCKQYAIAQEMDAASNEVPTNIMLAEQKSLEKDAIAWDSILPLPEKLAKATKNPDSPAGKFYQSLKDNKESLMQDLGIDSATYDQYAAVALKITKEESAYGQSKKYKIYKALEQTETGSKVLETARDVLQGDGTLSIGMSRFKIANASDSCKVLFDKYGITYDNTNSNILEPEKSAIATLIRLAEIGENDYPKYLASINEIKPDTSTAEAKQSIKNAQNILFNNLVRPQAMEALISPNGTPLEEWNLQTADLTEKDLEDLRFYASTVELSKDAYLAARWNGKAVLPIGDRKDIACRNLLNIAAQKGYVANIDKTSKVIY